MKKLLPLLLLGFFFLIPRANAAITIVASSSFSAATNNLHLTLTTNAGDLLIIIQRASTNASSVMATPTDSSGETWILATSTTVGTSASANMYYVANALATASTTCNFLSDGTQNYACTMLDIQNIGASSTLDVAVGTSTTTSATTQVSGPLTTTNVNDLLVFGVGVGGNQTSWTAGSPFTFASMATGTRTAAQTNLVSAIQTNATTSMSYGATGNQENIYAAFTVPQPIAGKDVTSTILTVSGALNIKGALTIN